MWKKLNKQVKELVKTYHSYQVCKKVGKKKYTLLPPNNAESICWNIVNADLWGLKSMANVSVMTYELQVMTMVNPVTGWFEQRWLHGNPYTCQQIPDNICLSRCPLQKVNSFYNGLEFKAEFKGLCATMDLKRCHSNAYWNPQPNAILILEWISQVLGDGFVR